jgi:hypothetical protein
MDNCLLLQTASDDILRVSWVLHITTLIKPFALLLTHWSSNQFLDSYVLAQTFNFSNPDQYINLGLL